MLTLDSKIFFDKWITDISDSQDRITGCVQYCAPYIYSGGGPSGWGAAIVILPYEFYKNYGDTEVLKKLYPQMLRYFDYLELHSENGLVTSDREGYWCLGEWACPREIGVILPPPFVNNYYYIKSLEKAIEIAKVIGREEDIPDLQKRLEFRQKITKLAYSENSRNIYFSNVQGAGAFALDMGIGSKTTLEGTIAYYNKIGHLDTGIFGTEVLIRILLETGNADLAIRLLTQTDTYGYGEWMKDGRTTFLEYWNSCARSHNHPMFGSVVAFLYDYLLGIKQKEGSVGYCNLIISPIENSLISKIQGSISTSFGEVFVKYEKKDSKITFCINIPKKIKADFKYKDYHSKLSSGENVISLSLQTD